MMTPSGLPMTPAQFITLNPTAFKETLERRVEELSDRVHTLTTELAVLQRELRLLRAGHKSSLEVKAVLMAREISV
jgi:poly(3-hydroxyalkanoate) synthetase